MPWMGTDCYQIPKKQREINLNIKSLPMNAVGYVRCAVADETGTVLARMENEIREYCALQNITLMAVFRDNGVSGANFQRPKWEEMLRYMKKGNGNIETLVVTRFDRIGRDMESSIRQIRELEKEYGIKILQTATHRISLPANLNLAEPDSYKSLIGRAVIVHPLLTADPYGKRGQVGRVSSVHPDKEGHLDIKVVFKNKEYGLYEADALYTLYPSSLINRTLRANINKVDIDERWAIVEILDLLKRRDYEAALSKTMADQTLQAYCCFDCQKWIEMKNRASIKTRNGLKK
jgi:hypothetical protein